MKQEPVNTTSNNSNPKENAKSKLEKNKFSEDENENSQTIELTEETSVATIIQEELALEGEIQEKEPDSIESIINTQMNQETYSNSHQTEIASFSINEDALDNDEMCSTSKDQIEDFQKTNAAHQQLFNRKGILIRNRSRSKSRERRIIQKKVVFINPNLTNSVILDGKAQLGDIKQFQTSHSNPLSETLLKFFLLGLCIAIVSIGFSKLV